MKIYPNWFFTGGTVKVPPPPELPKYDVTQEAPKWNWSKLWYSIDLIKQHPDKPKTGGQPMDEDKPDWRGIIRKNVIPLTPPERYNFGRYTPSGYFWFDTPDYADPFKKLRYAGYFFFKYGLLYTCSFAIFAGFSFNAKDLSYLIRRPLARFWLGGATASMAVITLANLRGNVDDHWNYALGGFLAGSVVGRKNHMAFLRQTFMWTIGSVAAKWNAETNGKLTAEFDFRAINHSMALGSAADYGFWSGDLRDKYYFRFYPEDPGRAQRDHPAC